MKPSYLKHLQGTLIGILFGGVLAAACYLFAPFSVWGITAVALAGFAIGYGMGIGAYYDQQEKQELSEMLAEWKKNKESQNQCK